MSKFLSLSRLGVGIIAFLAILSAEAVAQEEVKPELGKQTFQSVELPASTSTWRQRSDIGLPRPLDESKTDTVRYWIFLPVDYEANAESDGSPLVLFLHGMGERGSSDGEIGKVKAIGLPNLLERENFSQNFPCVAVSPQCHNGNAWSPKQLMLLLDHIEAEYKIDKSRIYVTGLSMGGFGTWLCLQESPERFAAGAPICGGGDKAWGEKLKDVNIWAFHGGADPVVPIQDWAQPLLDTIKQAGGRKLISTVYPGVGHDSWSQTYGNQLFYDWLFAQQLSER